MTADLPPPSSSAQRYTLEAEHELRIEVAFASSTSTTTLTLVKGSAEVSGVELASGKPQVLVGGGLKLAVFTWHGCVIDIEGVDDVNHYLYVSDETHSNISTVNTHAQLEALRDEAAAGGGAGPRVLVCGPKESGKTSLVKTLIGYAVKLGRTPLWVDLDPTDNHLSASGTLACAPMNRDAVTLSSMVSGGLPPSSTSPVVLWHGSCNKISGDLFKAQVAALGSKIDKRLAGDDWERSSGILVDTNGWIEDEGLNLLYHAVGALQIDVVLVIGSDRLYAQMRDNTSAKVIKVPRSDGVVSREAAFKRQARSRSMKRYFYGDMIEGPAPTSGSTTTVTRVPQLTPFLVQLPVSQVTIYKFASISLSASLLPMGAAQTTEAVQLERVQVTNSLTHTVLAVAHPAAVERYTASGAAGDLYEAGVAGFCAVEKIVEETDMIHLLSPCAGSLPSTVLLMGDVTWME